jgi:hypothetical protein
VVVGVKTQGGDSLFGPSLSGDRRPKLGCKRVGTIKVSCLAGLADILWVRQHPLCSKQDALGRLIRHALAQTPAPLALGVAVIFAPLDGLAVPGPGPPVGLPPARLAAGAVAVDVPPIASPVDGERLTADAALDEKKLQVPSAWSEDLDLTSVPWDAPRVGRTRGIW